VIGDLVEAEDAVERGIGETPNLDLALQGIAEPNTVVMGQSTRTLLGSVFKFPDLGGRRPLLGR
jgi:hypothetical protein